MYIVFDYGEHREHSGSVVECLTETESPRDGASPTSLRCSTQEDPSLFN